MLSSNITVPSSSEHQKVWDLLPWYVNHSLDSVEQDIVNKHVKTCITCRIELNQQQQVLAKIQQTDLLQQVSQVSFAQLRKRIEEQPSLYTLAKHNEPEKEPKFFSRQFLNFLKYTTLAASLLLLALPSMLHSLIDQSALTGNYRTLANSIDDERRGNRIHIIFADQVNSEQIEAILSNVSGHIVKGPSQKGVYEVQIGNQQTNSQIVKDTISHLRKNTSVVFAELAHGLPSSD